MRYFMYLVLFTILPTWLAAQSTYQSRVFVQLNDTHSIADLAALGLDVDHGDYAPHKHFIGDFSTAEIQRIADAGFSYEVQIEDVTNYYVQQLASGSWESLRNDHCDTGSDEPYDYDNPENFELGTMAGYYRYQEMLDELDEMRSLYPDLITPRNEVAGITTHEGYPIYWLRISDNPEQDETEPEVLYTALHHAREPGSLSQMIFFMWYVLENYETDPEIQYLVNETELYFMPCLNPDGYLWNETTNPDGGGFWRKNRRNNGDGTFGVDLNRNYGFGWGYDDNGSSPNTVSSVYRGPSAFSEPETQAVQQFCNEHEFQICLNYHTFGNLLIYPWGYLDTPTDEADIFTGMAEALNRENQFFAGTATETVGYTVNGVSDDWMYGETDTKPAIYSMTPEVGPGTFGFWPPIDYIETLCKSTVLQNMTAAHMLLRYGLAEDNSPMTILEYEGAIDYTFTRYGLQEGEISVSLTTLDDDYVTVLDGPQSYDLNYGESISNSFAFEVSTDIPQGTELTFLLSVDNGTIVLSDTLRKPFLAGEAESVFISDGSDLTDWDVFGNWEVTDEIAYSGSTCLTDSPNSFYQNNQFSYMQSPVIDLTEVENASLTFWTQWEIEDNYDYVFVSAVSQTTGNATPLCGLFTNPGSGFAQPEDIPLYDGVQYDWVQEYISLDDFIGDEIRIDFTLVTDGGVTADGYYVDDLEVTTLVADTTINTQTLDLRPRTELRLYPNPAGQYVWVELPSGSTTGDQVLHLYDGLGREVLQRRFPDQRYRLDLPALPAGLYRLEVRRDGIPLGAESLSIH